MGERYQKYSYREGRDELHSDMYISEELNLEQKLYRYLNVKQFISMIESNKTYLTRVLDWEDIWEAPLRKIPIDSDFEEGKEI